LRIYGSSRSAAFVLALAMVVLSLAVPAGCSKQASGRLKVTASIVPLADFVRNVGGDLVSVEVMVPPGASPHTYEPTAGQLEFLSSSRVLVINGLRLESWVTDVVRKVGNKNLLQVVTGDAVPKSSLLPSIEVNAITDEHIWLDPHLAIYQVNAIRDGLIEADPKNRDIYTRNANDYTAELSTLDKQIASETATFTKRAFISMHPSWAYFAKRYKLDQAGAIEVLPGKEPSAKQIVDLVDTIKRLRITVIFVEPQFNPKPADVIAAEVGGVQVRFIDPLGDPNKPDVSTYIKMMRHDVVVMGEVLK
jgi:zinc transport system substrate-binding protein